MSRLTNDTLTREKIMHTLATQLDDSLLNRFFPDHTATDIRRILTGTPVPKRPAASPAPPSPLAATPHIRAARGCRLFTDGASRGNPGQAGAGAVLYADNGEELAAKSVYLGTCTNNVAEYKALLIGLEEALRNGCTELHIALDSELIVRQIQGRYKVKNETLLELFTEVRKQLGRFNKWSISHVPRAQNARADQLANRGIDEK
jgi:ribonuclease HI/probable phosphoglycerate mutase